MPHGDDWRWVTGGSLKDVCPTSPQLLRPEIRRPGNAERPCYRGLFQKLNVRCDSARHPMVSTSERSNLVAMPALPNLETLDATPNADQTEHGGVIVIGFPTVMIGDG
jgi:hypothetical protein